MGNRSIAVMGLGYVGLATALTLSYLGHDVIGYDPVVSKVTSLSNGEIPIYEEGFHNLLDDGLKSGRLSFSNEPKLTLKEVDFVFICVGTPSLPNGQADLSQVRSAAELIGKYMVNPMIVINKSTVPVGTGDRVERWICQAQPSSIDVDVVSNPEFLREGSAVRDSLHPTRIVIGANDAKAGASVSGLFDGIDAPVLSYDRNTAEMVKYASNAFLATKISFINEIAAICDRVGADVKHVADGMGYDPRIGDQFLQAGVGYGGSCFPKDTSALIQIAGNVFYDFKLLKAVVEVNNQSRLRVVQMLEESLTNLKNRKIAVLGLSFKPNTDDIRESPALTIIPALLERGAFVRATDPVALPRAKQWFADLGIPTMILDEELSTPHEVSGTANSLISRNLLLTARTLDAVEGVDALLLLTDWWHYKQLDWRRIRGLMNGRVVIDGRNALPSSEVTDAGFRYLCIGRPNASRTTVDTV